MRNASSQYQMMESASMDCIPPILICLLAWSVDFQKDISRNGVVSQMRARHAEPCLNSSPFLRSTGSLIRVREPTKNTKRSQRLSHTFMSMVNMQRSPQEIGRASCRERV